MGLRTRSIRFADLGASIVVVACTSTAGPYTASIASGTQPRMTAEDAIRITRGYLDQQTPELAAPELHSSSEIALVWAVRASDAPALDGCIPAGQGDRILGVTKGQGEYLNLHVHAWSKPESADDQEDPLLRACEGPGAAGTLVIDDASGEILSVYPEFALEPHPTPSAR